MAQKQHIAILDFGSQYTHLIARRVRELGVISRIYTNDTKTNNLNNAVGIILSGGPKSLVTGPKLKFDPKIFKLNIPVLGLCYGHQLIAKNLGGKVQKGPGREYGLANLKISHSSIFKNIPKQTQIWMSHGDYVSKLPIGFTQIGTTGNKSIAAIANEQKKLYGFQFHPEVYHSKTGKQMLGNFIFNICKAKINWNTSLMLKQILTNIKLEAKNKKVFLLVSGGVDSTVCFALLEKTLGKNRVYGLHIDSGLMRLNETKNITGALNKIGFNNLHIYNAEKEFLFALKGITEPEQKRKIIGGLFLNIADKIMREKKMFGPNWLLGQGTIYPDTIESGGTKNADLIKTHHNRVPRVQQMILDGKIIEPIKDLYKDEVRVIGLKLGLPKHLIFRHPFPGPGLAIRCLCAKNINPSPIRGGARGGVYGKKLNTATYPLLYPPPKRGRNPLSSFQTYILPIKSVGVQGDERSYSHPALLVHNPPLPQRRGQACPPKSDRGGRRRGEDSPNWKILQTLSPAITNSTKTVNRVLYLINGDKNKLSKSIIRDSYLSIGRLNKLRKIDDIVNKEISKEKKCKNIWQLPVVLVPFGYKHGESIVLRPVESEEAMTVNFGIIPQNTLNNIIKKIAALNAVDYIFYDLTNKPPGTIEWE